MHPHKIHNELSTRRRKVQRNIPSDAQTKTTILHYIQTTHLHQINNFIFDTKLSSNEKIQINIHTKY